MDINTTYKVTIIDMYNELHEIPYQAYSYPNLMELIINHYYEEIGDCGGRGLCGTCHVQPVSVFETTEKNKTEIKTLNMLENSTNTSRLSCQILVNKKINGQCFKIINNN